MWGISWLAERLLDFQEGVYSVEFVYMKCVLYVVLGEEDIHRKLSRELVPPHIGAVWSVITLRETWIEILSSRCRIIIHRKAHGIKQVPHGIYKSNLKRVF
jgi:hypothetical protein